MQALRLKHAIGVSAQFFLSLGHNSTKGFGGAALALLVVLSLHPQRALAAPAATLTSANVNFGSVNLGSTSTLTLTFTFTSAGSIDAPAVLTQGAANRDFTDDSSGTCTTNGTAHVYNNADTCTVVVDFKPTAVGLRMGAVQLYSSGALVVTAPIYGVGTGPLAQFPAGGTQSLLGSSFTFPGAVAVDGAGDVFLADLPGLTGSIVEIQAGGTVQTLVSGLLNPSFGVAVDGAGNVYYTDFANYRVKEIVAVNGVVSPSSTVVSAGPAIPAPEGIAVDGLGNLFVTNGLGVYEIPAVNGAPGLTTVTVGSGWTEPIGVAVDSNGNLFVTDDGDILTPNSGTVKEVVPSGGVFNASSPVTTVAQNLNSPGGLAVDGGGNLYVADTSDGVLTEFIATGGVVNTSSVSQTLGTGFAGPNDVAIDGKGNLYVSDASLSAIAQIALTTPPALSFATTATGSTSTDSPQKVTLQNAGNDTMSVALPNPSTTSFALDNAATSCSTTMQASSTCTIGLDFTPQATGSLSANEVVADNSLNVANSTQTISLSGTGTPGATATTTAASSATATYDPSSQAITLAATVMAGSNPATTGTVTFTVMAGSTIVGGSTTSGAVTSAGAASVSYTLPAATTAGIYTIQAVYNPGMGYSGSSDSTHQLTIGKATPAFSTAPTATAITYGQTLASSTLHGGVAIYNSSAVAGGFAFTTPGIAPNAGTLSEGVTFTPTDTTDYSTTTGTASITVNQAAAVVAVTGYNVTYDGTAHSAIGTATGLNSANLNADLTLAATAHTSAGTFTDSWSFTDPNGNYAPQTGTVTDTITQAATSIAIAGVPGIAYEGNSFTPAYTYAGDGAASAVSQTPSVCTVSSGVVNYVSAGTCTLTAGASAGTNYAAATGPAQSFWIAPTEPVGSTHAPLTATVSITTAGQLGQINVLTQGAPSKDFALVSGGTCATGTTYAVNQTCTVQFSFTPSRPGQRLGAISLTTGASNSDTVLGTAFVFGMGTAPLATFAAAKSPTQLAGGFPTGQSVAVDASGDLFVADNLKGAITEVVAVNGVIPSSPTVRTLSPVFQHPLGVAVDGSGNVYVADNALDHIVEIVAVNGVIPPSPATRSLGSGFGDLTGVAIDGAGNVYSVELATGQVNEMVAINGIVPPSPAILTLASGIGVLEAIAVDGVGSVYVSDAANNQVKEITAVNGVIPSSPTIRTLGSGFQYPDGLAVDSGGSVYVADFLNKHVKKIIAVNGVVPSSPSVVNLDSGSVQPVGVAVDELGHVFITNRDDEGVDEIDLTQPPALGFATTVAGQTSTDSPQIVTAQNDGNQPLTFSAIGLTAGSSNFTLGSTGTCSTSTPLAQSGTCTVAASFTPTAAASPATGVITLTDDSLNVASATQSIQLSGTANVPATITKAGTATATYSPSSQSVALSATVTAGSSAATAGTVTFTVLKGTAPVGSPITSGTLSSTGTASVNYVLPAGTAAGAYTIQAMYNAGSGYVASSDSSQILTINQATPTIATAPSAATIAYSQTLADSTLTGGAATFNSSAVAGTFAFTAPATKPAVGTANQGVTFTPTDSTDYAMATANVSVTVTKATPTIAITGIPGGSVPGEIFIANVSYSGDQFYSVTITSETPTVCIVGPGATFAPAIEVNATGVCTLVASAPETPNYYAVTGAPQSFNVGSFSFQLTSVCTKNQHCVAPDKSTIQDPSAGEVFPITLQFTVTPSAGFNFPIEVGSQYEAPSGVLVESDCVDASGVKRPDGCYYPASTTPTTVYLAYYKSGSPSSIVSPQVTKGRTKIAGFSFLGALVMLVCTCFGRWRKFARNLVKFGAMIVLVISLGGWAGSCALLPGTSTGQPTPVVIGAGSAQSGPGSNFNNDTTQTQLVYLVF